MQKCHYRSRYCHFGPHPFSRLSRRIETYTWLSLYRTIERNGMPRIPGYSSGLDRSRLGERLAIDDESNRVFCRATYKIFDGISNNKDLSGYSPKLAINARVETDREVEATGG
jgi:hypothetical protein